MVFLHLVSRIYVNSMCHEDRHDWSYVRVLLPSLNGRGFEFGAYNIVHESNEMSFG